MVQRSNKALVTVSIAITNGDRISMKFIRVAHAHCSKNTVKEDDYGYLWEKWGQNGCQSIPLHYGVT